MHLFPRPKPPRRRNWRTLTPEERARKMGLHGFAEYAFAGHFPWVKGHKARVKSRRAAIAARYAAAKRANVIVRLWRHKPSLLERQSLLLEFDRNRLYAKRRTAERRMDK